MGDVDVPSGYFLHLPRFGTYRPARASWTQAPACAFFRADRGTDPSVP